MRAVSEHDWVVLRAALRRCLQENAQIRSDVLASRSAEAERRICAEDETARRRADRRPSRAPEHVVRRAG